MEKLKTALALAKRRRSAQDLQDLILAVEEYLETGSCASGCKLLDEIELGGATADTFPPAGEHFTGSSTAETAPNVPPSAEQGADVAPPEVS